MTFSSGVKDSFSSSPNQVENAKLQTEAFIAIDLLRQSVTFAEELFPPAVKSVLNSSEDAALNVLRPLEAVLEQSLTKIASYSSRMLFAPVKRGAQDFSWAAGQLETNGVGLPTSPSSSDVRSRVLQAAAKPESQPSVETSKMDHHHQKKH
ncbi:hypothetical protein DY000_02056650 [Brassica cretica]|uniref:Uncharacterized protein n=1 Tax=Brassica cretica TaxID=69181 RepID=A0ABQ7AE12_BRACR|nr:hypothetical protein DY000_02056650 [Brassica cretica]